MNTRKAKLSKWLAVLSSVVMLSSVVSGCGTEEESKGKIAVIGQTKGLQFWEDVKRGALDAGEEMNYEIIYNDAEGGSDIQGQIDLINSAIKQDVKAIVIAPNSATELNAVLQDADRAGIPIIAIDADLDYSGKKSYIGTNNTSAGSVAGRQAVKILGDGKSKIGIVAPNQTSITSMERIQGFKDEIKKMTSGASTTDAETIEEGAAVTASEVEFLPEQYCESKRENAKTIALDMIKSNPDLSMIYATNEASTLGVCDAVAEAGKQGVVRVIGFNASDEEIQYVMSTTADALIVQSPYNMGYLGVRYSDKVIDGKKISADIDTGVIVVTQSNINMADTELMLFPYDADGGRIQELRNDMRGKGGAN